MNDLTHWEIEVLRQEGEFTVARSARPNGLPPWLIVSPARDHPAPSTIEKLKNALSLRDQLDAAWAARPVELMKFRGRLALAIEDPGSEPLDQAINGPFAVADFLRVAIGIASALGGLHAQGLVHREVKPANLLVNVATGQAWLTGFGLASRLPRHRQPPEPIEIIAGTLAYMAPEQTGRMNRSIDSRSDLYSLGVTLYEMLTGRLPFTARDPMEWVHCHTAMQPASPGEWVENVPAPISAITMKLLAKTAEERYQTAAGLESDLRRCLSEWEAMGHINPFALGAHDTPDRLIIPEKLYGRDREIATLLQAFDRIVAGGRPELVLVSGYSGIGKSAVVNELHKPLVPPRGLFASGKFDQYKRDIPYATLAQAFQSLIRPLLSKSDEELIPWRAALREALDPNGALLVELIPELQHLIGEQPPVSELPTQDAQARFHQLLRRFIGVFARPEHPLALFLDDLQWLDAATLHLLEDLLSRTDLRHLLLIGAYRDNEVHPAHPLTRKLAAMRHAGAALHDIVLTPLGGEDLERLLADSLRCEPPHAAPLARLIHEKTSGNPFFAIQFLSTLADEDLLSFDYATSRWSWDLAQIEAKGFTDNVVDLMVGKLSRLPLETQSALQQFACLGNSAEFAVLQMVHLGPGEAMHEQLWAAVRAGLIFRAETSYRFLHDRVQEAAYSLIPDERRAETHLRIGRLLAANTLPERLDEGIFEIVNQLNRGLHLIDSTEERVRVAHLNLLAAKRAKSSTAYASALKYLEAGRSLFTETAWERNYDLVFSIECLTAECELLTAEMTAAEKRLTLLSQSARNSHDFAVVTRLRLTLYTTLDRSELAIEVFLDYLRRDGTDWPKHPTHDDVLREYDRIWARLGQRQIEDLINLPLLTDPQVIDMLDVCTEIVHPAMFYDENLSSLVVCRMVNLSLEHGNGDGSSFGYVWFAMFAGPRFNNYRDGFRFGQLGYDLVERPEFTRFQARTYITFSTLLPWARHAAQARELVRRAYDVACRMGDLTFSAYSWHVLITNYLMVGDPLEIVQGEAEAGLAFATKQGFGLVAANCEAQLGLIRTLRGRTERFGHFDDESYKELSAESHYARNPGLALSEFFYWTRKLQARFFAGDSAAAVDASRRADPLLRPAASQVETGDFRFYGALAHAAAWDSAAADAKQRHLDALTQHYRQLEVWAEHSPANFENRAALVGAEIARIEGRLLDAEHLYEKAIHSAHAHHFIHNEAVAHEVAAQFYRARGFATIADAYLRNARTCYRQWGAQGKVDQIEARFPDLKAPSVSSAAGVTIDTPVAQLDAEAVIRASQTLSREINLTSLIEKLMRLAVEHAGAQRGLLILLCGPEPYLKGEAKSERGRVETVIRHEPVQATDLPHSTLHYVLRTRERMLFDDASSNRSLSDDPYFRSNNSRSVLCLPIVQQAKVIGALYLENNLTAHAFTAGRVAVLEVLASQAAISLENARLYAELAQENQERRQAEAELVSTERTLNRIINTIPTTAWSTRPDGYCEYLNQRWLRYAGLSEDEARGWGWSVAIHPEDAKRLTEVWQACLSTGTPLDTEARIRRYDGVYRWFLFRANPLRDESGKIVKWYGTNIDMEDRKQAEEKLRRSEAFLSEGQRASSTGSFSWRVDEDLITFSEETRRIFGFAPDEPVTLQGIGDRIDPEDLPLLAEKTEAARATAADQDYEIRIRTPDGATKILHTISHATQDSEGRLEYIGAIQDVTARHLAEEQLRKNELHLRQMTETIPEMLWSATAEGAIDYCNGRLLEYSGFSAHEVMGAGWTKLLHPDDVEHTAQVWLSCVKTGAPYVVEVRTLHAADRSYRWCLTSAIPLLDPQGRILKWYGTVVDMHDRKQAEEELRRSEARKAAILDSALDCIVTIDHEGRITEFNPAAERTFGYRREEVLQKLFAEVVIPPTLRERYEVVAKYVTAGEVDVIGRRVELSAVRADGSEFPIEVAVTRIRSDGLPSFTGYLRDITDRKRAEEELRRSEASLREVQDELAHVTRVMTMGELAASIAHEVNQPIAGVVINGNACLRWLSRVQDDSVYLTEARETIQRIIRDGNRAGEIITRIRALFKKTELAKEPLDLNETIREILVLARSEMDKQRVTLHLELSADLPDVLGDRVQLQQVLLNLILNAIDAMAAVQGRARDLVIRTQSADEREVVVTVRDSGIGLQPESIDHVFTAFYTTKPGGLGMGLSISRSIVENHSGRLWVTAEESPGTSFHFSLPTVSFTEP